MTDEKIIVICSFKMLIKTERQTRITMSSYESCKNSVPVKRIANLFQAKGRNNTDLDNYAKNA